MSDKRIERIRWALAAGIAPDASAADDISYLLSKLNEAQSQARGLLRCASDHFKARNSAETALEKCHSENKKLKSRITELENHLLDLGGVVRKKC